MKDDIVRNLKTKGIDKLEELKKLDKIIQADEMTFALIYGRRRVGKSNKKVRRIIKKGYNKWEIIMKIY